MSNEQLAALLQHIARQIGGEASHIEPHAESNPSLGIVVINLHGLADLLWSQASSLGAHGDMA